MIFLKAASHRQRRAFVPIPTRGFVLSRRWVTSGGITMPCVFDVPWLSAPLGYSSPSARKTRIKERQLLWVGFEIIALHRKRLYCWPFFFSLVLK